MHTRLPWGVRQEQSLHWECQARAGRQPRAPQTLCPPCVLGAEGSVSAQGQTQGWEMERSLSNVMAFFSEQKPQASKGSGP